MSLRRMVRSRMGALVAIMAINVLGISVPVTALAAPLVYQDCAASSPNPAGTAPCLFTNFEMDGNTAVDTAGGVDWATSPFPYNRSDFTDLFSSTSDDGFVQGSDYLTQSQWVCTDHKNTPKDDLMGGSIAFGNANVGGHSHQIGYFQFSRVQGNGDTFVDFAFSKGTPPPAASATCTGLPQRQVGDVVITFVFTNGGGTNIVDAGTWNGSSFTSLPTGSLGTNFVAAFNADGTYGEGALDMTATGVGPFVCHEFGSVYMDSHASGQNDSNEMKDFISPELPPLCQTPTVATQSSSTGSSVAAGTVVHDTATVTGTAGFGNPTGSVDFHLCGPLASATGCTTGGTDIGSTTTSTAGTDQSGKPTETFTSPNTSAINAIGTYCWRADYAAGQDTNYNDATGPIDAAHECFTVVGNTSTSTTSSATGAQQPGVSVTDTATVSLTAPATGAAPTGTVTFKLCDPSATCTQVGDPVTLSGGSATSSAVSGSTTPNTLAIGKYCWEATYNATGNYNGSSELSHPAAECFTTGKQPTTTTTGVLSQTVDSRSGSATVNDNSDTPVFVPSGATLSPGTVTFRLYGPSASANCSTKLVYTSSALTGSYSAGHVSASVGPLSLATAGISSSGTYWWVATYSGDAYNDGSSSTCGTEAVQAVDAYITITPSSAVNEVGHAHTFTITYNAIPAGTTPTGFHISPLLSSTTNLTTNSNTCLTPAVSVSGNSASCTYTINASAAGTYTLNATGSVTMGGLLVSRSTSGDPGPGGSGAATKYYVDASIAIAPHDATNEVGNQHTFTITYTSIPGAASPVSFLSITPSINPQPGSMSSTCGNPVVDGNVATCTVTINNSTAGTFTLNASGSSSMGGVTVTRSTSGNSGPGGSTGAVKRYVDASIGITPPTATNVVGNAHTFTITLTAIPGSATPVGGFSISPSLSPTTGLTQNTNTCASPTVNGNVATCTYTINSDTVGTYTLNASGSVTMGGVTVTRSTSGNSGPGGSGAATKHYVNAALTITPSLATNEVGSPHTFTLTLTASPDDAGAPSNFVITPSISPTSNLTQNDNTCATPTVNGNVATCTYTINSDTAGTYTLNATGSVTIDTQTVHLTTVGGTGINGPATKHYVDASIAITPHQAVNVITHQHVFTVTLTAIPGGSGDPSDFTITPSISPTTGLTTNTNTCAEPTVNGNVATCTYTINSSTEGTYTLNATGSVTMGGVTVTRSTSGNSGPGGSGPATKTYVAPNSALVKAERDVTTPDTTQNGGGFTAGPITANQADVLEYQLTYTNTGKGAASDVVVTDVVPTNHASYLDGSCTGGSSCSYDSTSHTLTWVLGTMDAGSSAVLTFRITLGTDFPVGVLTQISNFGVVTTAEEGSKPSNTVVANVQPAQQVQAATVTLPQAGAPQSGGASRWLLLGFASLLVLGLVGGAAAVSSRRTEPVTTEES